MYTKNRVVMLIILSEPLFDIVYIRFFKFNLVNVE